MDIIDEIIKDAMQNGRFANLSGEGKPLKLDDDAHTPSHLRMAHKLLKENELAPEWILLGKEVDALREALEANIRAAVSAYRGALAAASRSEAPMQAFERADAAWQRAQHDLREQAARYNRQALTYNLKVPQGVTHKPIVRIEDHIRRILGKY